MTARQAKTRPHQVAGGDVSGGIHLQRRDKAGIARPECRQVGLTIGDDRHAQRFQHLQRFGQIKDRLGPGSHHGNRGLRQFLQVGGYVKTPLRPAMDAADATGGKDRDPGKAGADHGCGDRGCPGSALNKAGRDVGAADLHHAGRQRQHGQVGVRQSDVDLAPHQGYGRRSGPGGAYRRLDGAGSFNILRKWHAVGDDRGFERHKRGTGSAGCCNLGGE